MGSNLEDVIYVWLDSTGEPIAVNLASRGPCSVENPLTDTWNSEVQVIIPESGPVPDTATYIQKLEKEKLARESGEVKDNRSFFAKYVSIDKFIYQFNTSSSKKIFLFWIAAHFKVKVIIL